MEKILTILNQNFKNNEKMNELFEKSKTNLSRQESIFFNDLMYEESKIIFDGKIRNKLIKNKDIEYIHCRDLELIDLYPLIQENDKEDFFKLCNFVPECDYVELSMKRFKNNSPIDKIENILTVSFEKKEPINTVKLSGGVTVNMYEPPTGKEKIFKFYNLDINEEFISSLSKKCTIDIQTTNYVLSNDSCYIKINEQGDISFYQKTKAKDMWVMLRDPEEIDAYGDLELMNSKVRSLKKAVEKVVENRDKFSGSREWYGHSEDSIPVGSVYNKLGKILCKISYNGKAWKVNQYGKELDIELNPNISFEELSELVQDEARVELLNLKERDAIFQDMGRIEEYVPQIISDATNLNKGNLSKLMVSLLDLSSDISCEIDEDDEDTKVNIKKYTDLIQKNIENYLKGIMG